MSANGSATWARSARHAEGGGGAFYGKVGTGFPKENATSKESGRDRSMSLTRQMWFWLLAVVAVVGSLWLLREILLPFVAGMALAYLLDPLADRLERLGINRLVVTLLIVAFFVLAVLILVILISPILGSQFTAFIEKLPDYVSRLQALVTDPSRPWLQKI